MASARMLLRLIAYNLALLVALFAVGDFLLTASRPPPASVDKEYRIFDSQISHTLRPDYSTNAATWGNARYTVHTNSLGYKDASVRTVAKKSAQRRRMVFIGDSFTEGVGLEWGDTFVGRFAARVPDIEVLNAGVSSYSPSVYFRKIALLLEAGYAIDEVVVCLDVSDIQDEAVSYRENTDGAIVYVGETVNYFATLANPLWRFPAGAGPAAKPGAKDWMRAHFAFSNLLYSIAKTKALSRLEPQRKLLRSYWTIDPAIPGYGEMGVEGGLAKAMSYMDRLHALLAARGIALSVAVYPWPDQIEFDSVNSRQVQVWRQWCERNRCAHFIDHFPDFFAYKREHTDWRDRLFISGDFHHLPKATEMIAERFASVYVSATSSRPAPAPARAQ